MRRTGAMRTEHSFVLLLLNGTACLVSGDRERGHQGVRELHKCKCTYMWSPRESGMAHAPAIKSVHPLNEVYLSQERLCFLAGLPNSLKSRNKIPVGFYYY